MKKKYIFNTAILLGLLVSCGSAEENSIEELPAVAVKVGTAIVAEGAEVVNASGKIEAGNSANVSTRMMGNVTSVNVQSGDKVTKGDLLLTITNTDLIAKRSQVEAAIVQAQSGYANAKKDLERFKVLFEKGSASEKELENMTTRFEMAEAGLDGANQMKKEVNAQFEYTNIRAPFTGVIANTFVKVGDMANPGMPLVTVEGTGKYQAAVLVSESDIFKVKVGAQTSLIVKSNNTSLKGKVVEVSPSAKNTGGQFIVKIDIEDMQGILPGMFVNASITATRGKIEKTSPLVKESALITSGQLTGLYTLSKENTAILRWVRTGQITDGNVEILSGISQGEKYIQDADGKLFNGARVSVRQGEIGLKD